MFFSSKIFQVVFPLLFLNKFSVLNIIHVYLHKTPIKIHNLNKVCYCYLVLIRSILFRCETSLPKLPFHTVFERVNNRFSIVRYKLICSGDKNFTRPLVITSEI